MRDNRRGGMAANVIERMRVAGRGSLAQRFRLWSGLVLLAYVTLHYVNHSLGHVSLEAMETMLVGMSFVWASLPGQIVLMGALVVHMTLGLARIVTFRTWRRPFWEWAQVALGLAIPWFLISHIVYTRFAENALGVEVSYSGELSLLWPDVWIRQSLLLALVWLHACVGMHFWLRLRHGYERWFPVLASAAIAIPLLALTGWIVAARRQFDALQAAAKSDPAAVRVGAEQERINLSILDQLAGIETITQIAVLALIGAALAAMTLRWLAQRFRSRVRVSYGTGGAVTCTPGHTILEVSRAWNIPHMSVCGGRARCSTCRTLIVEGLENLSPPTEAEAALLRKLNAAPGIRLACQARVRGDIDVRPLIRPGTGAGSPKSLDPLGWGVEREIAVMFLDIRGFSRIAEKSLPYDVVFILNSLFGEIGAEIENSNGYIDKFMGDGLMALFGLATSPAEACRDAIRAALAAQEAAGKASRILTHHISEPVRIGVGIHVGPVVIGRIGRMSDQTQPSRLTAIGDTVNVAARLESATKELAAGIVASVRAFDLAGIGTGLAHASRHSIKVHNITEPVDVMAVAAHREFAVESGLARDAELGPARRAQPAAMVRP
jgi:adenylate cyclase